LCGFILLAVVVGVIIKMAHFGIRDLWPYPSCTAYREMCNLLIRVWWQILPWAGCDMYI